MTTTSRRAEAEPESAERRPGANSSGERTRSTLGKLLYAWSAAAKRRKLKVAPVRVAWAFEHYFKMTASLDTYIATGRACAFPSVERLAADIGAKRRTAQRAIRELEAAGLIECVKTRGGRRHTNEYWLVPQPPAGDGANRAPVRAVRGSETAPPPGPETAPPSGAETAPPVTARIPPMKGVKKERAPGRGAAPSRDAGAPRRRGGGSSGSCRDDGLDDYKVEDGEGVWVLPTRRPARGEDTDEDERSRPRRSGPAKDEYEAWKRDHPGDYRDKYEWLRDQLGDLSATEAAALVEKHRPRLDQRDYVSLKNVLRRKQR